MKQWIVIGDAAGVRIFSTKGNVEHLEFVKEISNPTARQRTQELVSDEPGRQFGSRNSPARSAAGPHTTAHDEAAIDFARSLAHLLNIELEREAYSAVSLVAPPHFLGLLRSMLSREVAQHIHNTLAKDLARVSPADLPSHLEPLQFPAQQK
jgi:protein required for attachment to host cells